MAQHHEAHHAEEHHHHHVVPLTTYFAVFGALLLLLALTYGAYLVHLGPLNLTVAMVIAVCKALLIVLFFMHVKYSSKLVMLFAGLGFIFLLIGFLLTFSDYLTRGWIRILSP
jgi:cytochrome c oxidase subunit 4